MAIPVNGYLGDPNRTTAEFQDGIDDLTEALNDPTTGLDAKQGSAALGTAAFVNTGTGAGDAPLNSQLGTAAARDVGTGSTQLPTTAEADARYINTTGDTLTGQLNGITPASAANLVRKDYVDDRIENSNWVLKFIGGTTNVANSWGSGKYYVQVKNLDASSTTVSVFLDVEFGSGTYQGTTALKDMESSQLWCCEHVSGVFRARKCNINSGSIINAYISRISRLEED